MLRRFALEQDIARRVTAVQSLLKEKEIGALVIVAGGGPGMNGMARYLSNLVMWAGRAYVILGADHHEPAVVQSSSYGAKWNSQEVTTSWVENPPADAFARVIEIAKELSGSTKRIAVEHVAANWMVGEWDQIRAELHEHEFVDMTKELDAVRSIKTAFEVEAIYDMGRLMASALTVFDEVCRPGVRAWDAAAAAQERLLAAGCFWGRQKFSLDLRPYTIPTPLDRRFTEDDIILFELVYNSPLGYWCEMTNLYSFKPLPAPLQAQLNAQERVIEKCALVAKPGIPIGRIAEVSNQTWKELGFSVIGKHTPDCHSTGMDEVDGPSSWFTPETLLEANMVLSFHPSTLLEGDKGFLISDNFLVTPAGAVRLSPKTHFYKQLPVS
ncbi:M24 family metallopeptidase [bacterium]|nr:M24 family metallopeptidase [bacterium]